MGTLNQGNGIISTFPDKTDHFYCAYCANDTLGGIEYHGAGCPLMKKSGAVFLPPKPIPLVDTAVKEGFGDG